MLRITLQGQPEDGENRNRIDHPNHTDTDGHFLVDHRFRRRARWLRHDVRIAFLQPQRQRRRAIADQIQPEELHRLQRDRHTKEHGAEDDQDFADITRQQEVDELADVRIDDPPLLDRRNDAGEVVVGQHHVRRLLGDVGTGDAHGHADVGALQGRRVIDPVASHGYDVAVGFHGIDDARLVLRGNAAANLEPFGARGEVGVAHGLDFRPGQHQPTRLQHADFAGDGFRRVLVVAGDHHALQTGAMRHLERLDHLGPCRVDHAQQTKEGEFAFDIRRAHILRHGGQRTTGNGQHAQGAARHIVIARQDFLAQFGRHGHRLAAFELAHAQIEHHVRRALDEQHQRFARQRRQFGGRIKTMHGGHPLAFRIKGDFLYAGQLLVEFRPPQAALSRQRHHRPFGRVADDTPGFLAALVGTLFQTGVVTDQRPLEQQCGVCILCR